MYCARVTYLTTYFNIEPKMTNYVLRKEDGSLDSVEQGESCDIVVELKQLDGTQLVKASISDLRLTLTTDGTTVVNSRSNQNILDLNGGYLAEVVGSADGPVLTMKLDAADTGIEDTDNVSLGEFETREALISWTYTDNDGDQRIGKQVFEFKVERLT